MSNFFQTLKQLTSQGIEGYFAIKYAEFAKNAEKLVKGTVLINSDFEV